MFAYKTSARLMSLVLLAFLCVGPVGVALAQQVKVTSAEPASAAQGTTSLDVTIGGSGFDDSAAVKFLVAGTPTPGGIVVTKVVVVNPKKLVATIDVEGDAVVGQFDIEVSLSSDRKGKGTTLFSVSKKAADPCIGATAAFVFDKESPTPPRMLYLSNESGTCQRALYTFGTNYAHQASFRVVNDGQEGRVVVSDGANHLLLIRFPIGPDMQVGPESITVRRIFDPDQDGYVDNTYYDLAADGRRLAYVTSGEDGTSGYGDLLFKLRYIDDVDTCAPSTPEGTACRYDAGTLLAERVGIAYNIGVPRWSPDGSWIYIEDRRGDYYLPYISRVSPLAPLPPGGEPEVVVAGGELLFFETRSISSGDVLVYGEREGLACHQVRVVSVASCSGGACSVQVNSLSPRVLARWATVQSIGGSSLTLQTAGAKEDRKGRCTSTNDIVRAVDSLATGVQTTTIVQGAHMPAAK
jgi:hypothetical protein